MHGVFYVIAAVCSSSENAACNNVAAIRRNVLDLQHSHIKLLERIVQSEEELAGCCRNERKSEHKLIFLSPKKVRYFFSPF